MEFTCPFLGLFSHLNKVCNHPSFIILYHISHHRKAGKSSTPTCQKWQGICDRSRVSFQNLNLKDLKTSHYVFFRIHIYIYTCFFNRKNIPSFIVSQIFFSKKNPSIQLSTTSGTHPFTSVRY